MSYYVTFTIGSEDETQEFQLKSEAARAAANFAITALNADCPDEYALYFNVEHGDCE